MTEESAKLSSLELLHIGLREISRLKIDLDPVDGPWESGIVTGNRR
jgi:hypothetical protein